MAYNKVMNRQESDPEREQPAAPRRRTGGRSARVRQAVLAATLEQVAEHGIEGLAIGEVAARAGVAETTVYRRWGTRTALIAEAIGELADMGNPAPDTGTLRGDLHRLAEQISTLIAQPGIARVLGTTLAFGAGSEIAIARQRFWDYRFEQTAPVVHRAIARGELPAPTSARAVIETLAAPLYFRLIIGDVPIEGALLDQCVEHTMTIYSRPH